VPVLSALRTARVRLTIPVMGSGRTPDTRSAALAPGSRSRNIGAMAQVKFGEEVLWQLQERNPRFQKGAFLLVLAALNHVMDGLPERRHISGRELAEGVRDVALDRFGVLARTVLEHWGIRATEDVGEVVFTLVEGGVLVKQDEDRIEDFREIYDFREVFEEAYPWGRHLG
jgi:uncharacterized repeat protein (TIGR04138 family)